MGSSSLKIPWMVPSLGKEELAEVIDSFESNWLTRGPKVQKFEEEMAAYLDVPHAVAVSNGTVALDIILKTIGISPGDEVIIPAMTYFATASSVSYQNAIPVFVDIQQQSFNLDPDKIPPAIMEKTKAIVFIDYGGNPSNFEGIAKVGKEHGIPVVQDGAQSLGAVYRGKPMGSQTEISTMSFHMAKVMTTIEGGMIFTHNEKYWEEVMIRANQGEPRNGKYTHVLLGTNARMTDIQAGVGLAQFKKLPDLLKGRRRVAEKYDKLFSGSQGVETIAKRQDDCQNAYFFYPILVEERDRIASTLREKYGIDTRVAYPMPVYQQKAYANGSLSYRALDCPVAENVTSQILNLPIFPDMTEEMIEEVAAAVNSEVMR